MIKIDWESVWSSFKLHKGLILKLFLGLVLLGGILFTIDKCSGWWFRHKMTQANANLAKALDQLSNIQDQKASKEKELEQANVDEANQKEIVIQAAKDAEIAANAERQAQVIANQAVENVNAINAQDFNGTTLENAEKARCRAFPSAPECNK